MVAFSGFRTVMADIKGPDLVETKLLAGPTVQESSTNPRHIIRFKSALAVFGALEIFFGIISSIIGSIGKFGLYRYMMHEAGIINGATVFLLKIHAFQRRYCWAEVTASSLVQYWGLWR